MRRCLLSIVAHSALRCAAAGPVRRVMRAGLGHEAHEGRDSTQEGTRNETNNTQPHTRDTRQHSGREGEEQHPRAAMSADTALRASQGARRSSDSGSDMSHKRESQARAAAREQQPAEQSDKSDDGHSAFSSSLHIP